MPKVVTNRIHVLPDKRFGFLKWIVLFVNKELRELPIEWCSDLKGVRIGVYGKFRVKTDAIAEGMAQAKKYKPSSLRIHKATGQIQQERSYGVGSESPRKG